MPGVFWLGLSLASVHRNDQKQPFPRNLFYEEIFSFKLTT